MYFLPKAVVGFWLICNIGHAVVTVWEEDSEVNLVGFEKLNPRVTGCLPKSVYDEYPILVIPYGPVTEWPLDGSFVDVALPVLSAAHTAAAEQRKMTTKLTKVENLLRGDKSSKSLCSPSVKQACFWPWSPQPSVLEDAETIRLTRDNDVDSIYAHAQEDLFSYLRDPAAAIRSVCDTQPSTIDRYSNLFGTTRNETENDLCVYISLYAVRYVVRGATSKVRRHDSANNQKLKSKLKGNVKRSSQLSAIEANELYVQSTTNITDGESCDLTSWLRLTPTAADVTPKTFRFLVRVDMLLARSNSRFATTEPRLEEELEFVTDEFFSVEQRAEVNDAEAGTKSTETVRPMSTTCQPFGCHLRSQCSRLLVFADSRSAAPAETGSIPSFLWKTARIAFDTSKWLTTTTTTTTVAPTSTPTKKMRVEAEPVQKNSASNCCLCTLCGAFVSVSAAVLHYFIFASATY